MYIIVFILSIIVFAYAEPGKAPLVQLNDGRTMPTIALGTWLGNSTTGRITPVGYETEQAVLWAFEAGYRHIDTAWSYHVEDQVGRAVKTVVDAYNLLHEVTTTPKVCDAGCYVNRFKKNIERSSSSMVPALSREEIFVTTKLWNDAHARSAVVPALRASLAQLKLNYVDLYLMHWPLGQFANGSYDYTHYLETWRGMMDAQALNLTRSIGVSNFNKVMLENVRAHQLTEPAVLQIEWNINLQQPGLLAYCRQHNISVMGYTPFGALMDKRRADSPTHIDDPQLTKMAAKYGKNVQQILLRYAVEMGVIPIPKSITSSRIFENIDIFDFQLEDNDKRILRKFDRGYRTIPQLKWRDHPFYPFEKKADYPTTSTSTVRTDASTQQVISKGDLNDKSAKMNFRDIKI
ncbi:aldo-keto reductase AKR2E4-like isoform X1 [Cydia pomonella]|uniref:aldo-keto reductase AKR2E4-like isoform X1 n=1 Tax=Cydia pomonella TaxID=82600 RepID=UPI002ADD6AAE|nr:aldo-keto reductase AKR2E4-like isoform X1 [Cydia pomonella]